MYDENDYIMKQIKGMVKGLGKFMGLEQIKELLQIDGDHQADITDLELETIISVSKLEIIMRNKEVSVGELSKDLMMEHECLNMLITHEAIATQEDLDQLNNYIQDNQSYL